MGELRYWVYVHDNDGELCDDLGEFATIQEASEAIDEMIATEEQFQLLTHTIRIVDNDMDGRTIWLAGNMKYITSIAGTLINA